MGSLPYRGQTRRGRVQQVLPLAFSRVIAEPDWDRLAQVVNEQHDLHLCQRCWEPLRRVEEVVWRAGVSKVPAMLLGATGTTSMQKSRLGDTGLEPVTPTV